MNIQNKGAGIKKKVPSRFLNTLRTILVFLFVSTLSLPAANSFSQRTTFSFNTKSATIKSICSEIEKNSNYNFVFSGSAGKIIGKRVGITANSESVEVILNEIFRETNLTYRILDNQIVVYEKNKVDPVIATSEKKDEIIEQQEIKQITVSGVVVDAAGISLPGVNIRLKSNRVISTATNLDGAFAISVPAKNDALIFTYLGMKPREIALSPSMERTLRVIMQPDEKELGGIIVTGIFNKARESYTGAATSITSDELLEVGNRSLLTSIQNIDPSFNIMQDNLMGSNPNALPSITIRGSSSLTANVRELQEQNQTMRDANQPLFIMDGFEISLTRFMDLDENQVESITLLKDNSATSLYGSRGANGVVVIVTKRPKEGVLRVTYRGGMNVEAPDLSSYSLLNAREKLAFEKAAGLYYSSNANHEQSLLDLYNRRKIDAERGLDTYWISYPVRVGTGQKHSIRLEGGDQGIRYAAGLGYNNIKGAMKGSDRNTFNGNVFLQYRFKNLIFQNDLQVSMNKATNSPYGTFQDFAKINSYWTPYDEDGNIKKVLENFYYLSEERTNFVYNPLYNALLPQRSDSRYLQLTNNFSIEWRINQDLFMRGRLSMHTNRNRSDTYVSAKDTRFDGYTGDNLNRRGLYTYGTGESSGYEGDITLNYSKLIDDKHLFSAGLGYNIGESKNESYSISAEGIANINMDFLGMASQYYKNGAPSGSEGISRRVGVVFTGNYTFANRYFWDVSARGEGSSRYGSDNRFAPFWSTGIGWNIHQESFLKGNKTVSMARLKLSYGTSGSQNFSPYQALTTFRDYGGSNYRTWNGVYLLGLGNKDLGWQTTRQTNIGTELEFFQRRVRFNLDVYNKITDNLLADINLPSSSGFDSYKANVGKVLNRGFETSFNAYIIRNRKRDISWNLGGSMIHNRNEILEISNSLQYLNEQLLSQSNINPSFLFKEGQSIYTIYAVRSKGIDPSNGREIYIKHDGSETYDWDANDKVPIGVGTPKYQGNLNTALRYKGFTFNAIFSYRMGGQIYNSTLVNKVENIYPYDNADKRVLYDRWKEPGDIVFFKSVKDRTTTNATSRFVMDENTLEFRTISLGYEFPREWLKKHFSIEYLNITGYTEDIFYTSSIRQERGLSYPYSKKFSVSLTARF